MQPIEIFRPGTHTDSRGVARSYSDADLAATAAAYDTGLHEAPIVVGHPTEDAPAYGWIKGVTFADGKLSVEPDQVDPEFAELVKGGRFKKVSASFYPPNSKSNPKPGAWYLRHVGFLGAQAPAIKGLKPIAFADDEADVVSFGDEPEASLLDRVTQAIEAGFSRLADGLPKFTEPDPKKESDMPPEKIAPEKDAEFAEREAAITADQDKVKSDREKLDKEAAEFAEKKSAARREADAVWLDGLIEAGRVAPGHKDGLVAFMAGLDSEDEAVSFGEEGKETKATAHGYFRSFLEQMPKGIDFSERAGETGNELDTNNSDDIAEAAVIYQEEMAGKGVTVATDVAVRHVMKGADA